MESQVGLKQTERVLNTFKIALKKLETNFKMSRRNMEEILSRDPES